MAADERDGAGSHRNGNGRARGRGRSHRGRSTAINPGPPVRPSRALGQNFLQDAEVARWIADQLPVAADDLVVELGPGGGALTEWLIGRGRRLLAIERDDRLAAALAGRWEGDQLEVVAADGAAFDRRPLFAEAPVRLVGNLPYSVGTQLLLAWLRPPSPVATAVLMLQKEVVNRLCAAPGGGEYGSLTLQVGLDWLARPLRTVGPEVFKPRPAVDSAVVLLEPRPPGSRPPVDRSRFETMVRIGFSQRRKQVKNLLPPPPAGVPEWPELARRLGCAETARAQELDLDQWITLTNIHNGAGADGGGAVGQRDDELFDVVDERDQVVGTASRGEVHARGMRHRAVHIFLCNRDGEVWLQKRSHLKDRQPLKWDSSAAGHVDAGESYDRAAAREVAEELGLDLPLVEVGALSASAETDQEFVRLYRAGWNGKPLRYPPAEIDCGEFFTIEQIDRWAEARPGDFAPGFLACWRLYRECG